jgi:hypothetical protein
MLLAYEGKDNSTDVSFNSIASQFLAHFFQVDIWKFHCNVLQLSFHIRCIFFHEFAFSQTVTGRQDDEKILRIII